MGRWKGCDNANFTGMCQDFRDSLIECHDLPVELKDRMTSVAVVSGQYCWFFEGNKCLGTKLEVKPPGTLNLRGRRFDNAIRSWKCWKQE
ncbi:hypothetical protein BDV95DRAFT_586739 [Massariosphaeria phaeospora]|uniref:Uncharacterized protein n=1 Tax=Massariosphaeria phaeospora TaxID=100035 RepID=A0A7C8M010_9PLEO|nr:hypothetical protein BDV95DRAFT_586739 [Massariosphaeria phaeospora]